MEFIGTVQFFNKNGKRANPMALYLERTPSGEYCIRPTLPQWRHLVGSGMTPNKAAGDFEIKLKGACPDAGAYDGPAWNGIKAEKPVPPKPVTSAGSPQPVSPGQPNADTAVATKPSVPDPTAAGAGLPGLPAGEEATKPV